jgi:DNA-directed RNA polymerase subunit RPC12/RpoP
MKPSKTLYKIKTWYILSCGCSVSLLIDRIQNGAVCPRCFFRVFILETCYEKPDGES